MTYLQAVRWSARLVIAAGWALAAAILPLGNWLPVAVPADAVKAAADAPLDLKPGQELPKGKWVDVMSPVDPDWDTVSGLWRKGAWDGLSGTWRPQGSELTVTPSLFQRVMLPVELEGSYELKAEFTRITGANSIEIIFPVGKTSCMLNLAARRESLHGLSLIDGRDVADRGNSAVFRPAKLIDKQRYIVLISVRLDGDNAKIEVSLDNHPIISWNGRQESLDVETKWAAPKLFRPALACNNTDVVFHSALVRATSGKARMAPPHASPAIDMNDSHWADLLKEVNPERDAIHGRWLKAAGEIMVAPASQTDKFVRLMFSRSVEGSYDLLAEFTRTKGSDSVTFTLPVGTRQCNLNLSAFIGRVAGLETIDGRPVGDFDHPAIRQPSGLVNDRRHQVLAQVRANGDNAVIDTWLDERPFIHWAGKQSSLDIPKDWSLPERWHVGVGANQCGVTFHTIRLRQVKPDATESE